MYWLSFSNCLSLGVIISRECNIDCAEISLIESGVVLLKYKPDYEVDLQDVIEVEKAFIDLTNSGDIYCLMDDVEYQRQKKKGIFVFDNVTYLRY